MSDNIPFEIQSEIIKRLPIKPLIQFRSVSKTWKSLIDSSEFIANYHVSQHHHLLVSYTDNTNNNNNSVENYVSVADNDTFPRHIFPLTAPVSVKPLIEPTIVSSQGLICFCAYEHDSEYQKAVIWNPNIRKSVSVVVPDDVLDSSYETVVGFGVCPSTCDPMLVKVVFNRGSGGSGTIVEVFSFGVGAWRRLEVNLPRKSIAFTDNNVAIGRFIYWHAYQQINSADAGSHWSDLIVSFDMMSEEFMEIRLPDCLALDLESSNFISKMGESLVVVQIKTEAGKDIYSVWEMEDGVPKSFKKLFTIKTPHEIKYVLGFTKSGKAIIEMGNDREKDALFVYEPNSESTNQIGITGKPYSFYVSSYMETLLLLDH